MMAVQATIFAVPSDGTPVTVVQSTPSNASSISIRNTGTIAVLLGTTGSVVFPLLVNEFLGLQVGPDDTLISVVQTNGTAGQLTVLGVN